MEVVGALDIQNSFAGLVPSCNSIGSEKAAVVRLPLFLIVAGTA